MSKHVDVIALVVIVLGLLAFTKAPKLRLTPHVNAASFSIPNTAERADTCPLSRLFGLHIH